MTPCVRLRTAWLEWARTVRWDLFVTLTFERTRGRPKPDFESERADKAFRRLIRFLNEALYGRRWLRTTAHKGVIWIRTREAHEDGAVHLHACIHLPEGALTSHLIRCARDWWGQGYGFARMEPLQSIDAVVAYLVKSVGSARRGAVIDISHNFPRHP